jgi:zinc transport system ATP-binding protein
MQPIIKLENVDFSYGKEKVLENVSLEIFPGEYVGIVGPNGSGKTTLVKIMLGLLTPSQGSIHLHENLKSKNTIGYVSQKGVLSESPVPISVEEVVSLGISKGKNVQLIDQALETVDMLAHKKQLITELSGGQQQRVFIARALVSNPTLLVLDEPTTGVDTESQDKFYELLSKLNKNGITLVMISHDMDLVAKEVGKVACINKRLLYFGPAKEFLESENIHLMHGETRNLKHHNHV